MQDAKVFGQLPAKPEPIYQRISPVAITIPWVLLSLILFLLLSYKYKQLHLPSLYMLVFAASYGIVIRSKGTSSLVAVERRADGKQLPFAHLSEHLDLNEGRGIDGIKTEAGIFKLGDGTNVYIDHTGHVRGISCIDNMFIQQITSLSQIHIQSRSQWIALTDSPTLIHN
jgi:hypothetical protein